MNLEDHTDFDYGNFALYLNGVPVVYGVKHDKKYSLDMPYTASKLFGSNQAADSYIEDIKQKALATTGGSFTFTVNHSDGKIKQVIVNGYKRIKFNGEKA